MRAILALAAVPPVVVTLALAAVATAELAGWRPLARPEGRGLPEAIVLGDSTGAARRLESGVAPGAIDLIRRSLLFEQPVLATAFEAAVLARDVRMLRLLQTYGAGADRVALLCLAHDVGAPAIAAELDRGEPPACEPGRALANVLVRPGP